MTDYIRTRKAVCTAIRLLMHEAAVDPRVLDLPLPIVEEIVADTFDEADAVTALRAEVRKAGTWKKAKADEHAAWTARYEADQKAKAEAAAAAAEAADLSLPLPFEEQAAE